MMEEVIQVLVFVVIITSVIISKYKEVNANRPGQHVGELGQSFDDPDYQSTQTDLDESSDIFNMFGSEEFNSNQTVELNTESADSFNQSVEKSIVSTIKNFPDLSESKVIKEPVSSLTKVKVVPSEKSKIRLRTRGEAREAFIYSEIFNRRYE